MNADAFCRSLKPQYATVDGIRTHYVVCGQGPTVVLLHGLSASFWNWWHTMPALAEHFQVVAYDLKGCGNSEKSGGDYTPQGSTNHLLALLDYLHIERAALVAHSMGTRIALNTAISASERVQTMVLVSPSCYPQTAGRPISFLVLPGVGELATRALFAGRVDRLVQKALRFCMHPSIPVAQEEIFWNMQSGTTEQYEMSRSYLRYGRHMQFHRPWAQVNQFSKITTPTLIINGEDDPFVPVAHCEQLVRALPRAQLELWPLSRHMPFAEYPERFNSTVTTFLRWQLQGASLSTAAPEPFKSVAVS